MERIIVEIHGTLPQPQSSQTYDRVRKLLEPFTGVRVLITPYLEPTRSGPQTLHSFLRVFHTEKATAEVKLIVNALTPLNLDIETTPLSGFYPAPKTVEETPLLEAVAEAGADIDIPLR